MLWLPFRLVLWTAKMVCALTGWLALIAGIVAIGVWIASAFAPSPPPLDVSSLRMSENVVDLRPVDLHSLGRAVRRPVSTVRKTRRR